MGPKQISAIPIGRWRISTKALVALVIAVILFLIPTMGASAFHTRVIINMCIFIILVSGFRLLLSAGVFSLAPQAFFSIGAYTSAILVTRYDFNWWLSLLLAGLVATAVAAVIGRILLRLRGIFFAISTLAFAFVLLLFLRSSNIFIWKTSELFGGHNGIFNIPPPDPIGSYQFGSISSYFYLGLALVIVTILVMYRIENSRYGFTLRCIELNTALAASTGVNVMVYRLTAFCVGCFFSGLAGAFFASFNHSIQPAAFEFSQLVLILLYAVIGGTGSVWGPIYGVVIMRAIPVGLNYIPNYDPRIGPIILGVILVVVMLRFPKGLGYVLDRIPSLLQRVKRKEIEGYADT